MTEIKNINRKLENIAEILNRIPLQQKQYARDTVTP